MIALSELASKKLHFIGIGGAGMSGLARIALTHGAHVSGSDEKDSSVLAALSALGATVFSSHKNSQVTDADLVIYSNAISKSNPEIVHANELGIPVYTRASAGSTHESIDKHCSRRNSWKNHDIIHAHRCTSSMRS